jgi:hypothetical protein
VSLAQASWLTVVVICGIAALIVGLNGYTGYSVVLAAVGASAAVNLV